MKRTDFLQQQVHHPYCCKSEPGWWTPSGSSTLTGCRLSLPPLGYSHMRELATRPKAGILPGMMNPLSTASIAVGGKGENTLWKKSSTILWKIFWNCNEFFLRKIQKILRGRSSALWIMINTVYNPVSSLDSLPIYMLTHKLYHDILDTILFLFSELLYSNHLQAHQSTLSISFKIIVEWNNVFRHRFIIWTLISERI